MMIKFKSAAGFFIKALSLTIGIIILEVILFGGSLVVSTLLIGGVIAIFGTIGELLPVRSIDPRHQGHDEDADINWDLFENSISRNQFSVHNNELTHDLMHDELEVTLNDNYK